MKIAIEDLASLLFQGNPPIPQVDAPLQTPSEPKSGEFKNLLTKSTDNLLSEPAPNFNSDSENEIIKLEQPLVDVSNDLPDHKKIEKVEKIEELEKTERTQQVEENMFGKKEKTHETKISQPEPNQEPLLSGQDKGEIEKPIYEKPPKQTDIPTQVEPPKPKDSIVVPKIDVPKSKVPGLNQKSEIEEKPVNEIEFVQSSKKEIQSPKIEEKKFSPMLSHETQDRSTFIRPDKALKPMGERSSANQPDLKEFVQKVENKEAVPVEQPISVVEKTELLVERKDYSTGLIKQKTQKTDSNYQQNTSVDFPKVDTSPIHALRPQLSEPVLTNRSVTVPVQVERQVVDQIIKNFQFLQTPAQSEVKMTIEPKEFGQIKMNMVIEDQNIRIQFDVDHAQVKEIIQSNGAQLRASLNEQGLNIDRFDVFIGGQGSQMGSHTDQENKNFSKSTNQMVHEDQDAFVEKDENAKEERKHLIDYVA